MRRRCRSKGYAYGAVTGLSRACPHTYVPSPLYRPRANPYRPRHTLAVLGHSAAMAVYWSEGRITTYFLPTGSGTTMN